jgi:hypothetical protein
MQLPQLPASALRVVYQNIGVVYLCKSMPFVARSNVVAVPHASLFGPRVPVQQATALIAVGRFPHHHAVHPLLTIHSIGTAHRIMPIKRMSEDARTR